MDWSPVFRNPPDDYDRGCNLQWEIKRSLLKMEFGFIYGTVPKMAESVSKAIGIFKEIPSRLEEFSEMTE